MLSCARAGCFAAVAADAGVSDRPIANAATPGATGKYRTSATARQIARTIASSIGAVWTRSPACLVLMSRSDSIVANNLSVSSAHGARVAKAEAGDRPSAILPGPGAQAQRCVGTHSLIGVTKPTASMCCTLNLQKAGCAMKSIGTAWQGNFTGRTDLFHVLTHLRRRYSPARRAQFIRTPALRDTVSGACGRATTAGSRFCFICFRRPATRRITLRNALFLALDRVGPMDRMARFGGYPRCRAEPGSLLIGHPWKASSLDLPIATR